MVMEPLFEKCIEDGEFLMNLIYLASIFLYPLPSYFSCVFLGLLFYFKKGEKNGLNMVKMEKTKTGTIMKVSR